MKKTLSMLLAILMIMCMSVMAFAANANDTSFTSEWTDAADDAWATTDDSANAANVDVGIKDGVAALVITGNASATSGHNVGAWYANQIGNASPRITEFDFSVNEGGVFHVRGWNNNVPGYSGFTIVGGGGIKLVVNGDANVAPDVDVTITPDTVHNIRMENVHSTNTAINGYTVGTKYFLDGELIFTTTNGAYYNKLSVCAGKNSTVKLYEIRESGGIRSWGSNCGVTTNFTGKSIADIEAKGILTGIGSSDANVTAEIVSQTDDVYLALDRVGVTNSGATALASMIYTLPAPATTEEYNLNIDFIYKGRNAPEIRMVSGNTWFTQMRISEGKIQISSNNANANKYDIKDDVYLAPFTKHTITISGNPVGSSHVFNILVDGRMVAEGLTPISSGHINTLPAQIQIYSHQQTSLNGSLNTNGSLFGGYYIKSITVTDPNAVPELAPTVLDDREIRFDGKGENLTASMRFKASVTPAQKLASAECGMLATRKSFLTELDEELTFDLGSDYYAYGVAYTVDDNGEPIIDKIVENDDNGNEIFAAVITGIENTNEAQVNEVIVVRPYIKVINGDGVTYFYGNTVEASLVEIAAVIDTDELTDEQMANINSILALAK